MSQSSNQPEEDPRIVDAKARYKAAFDVEQYELAKCIQKEINGLRQDIRDARQGATAPAGN